MPPSSQPIEEINMENTFKEIAEAAALHMGKFVNAMAEAANEFVSVMNPAESEEVMKYIRDVLTAVDNVVLVTTMQHENDEAREMLAKATDLQITGLIEMHNKEEVKH